MPKKLTTEEFVIKAKLKQGDAYSYEKTEYTHSYNKVIITCATHGDFEQQPKHHLSGSGCPRCAASYKATKTVKTIDNFIKDAEYKHGELYSYINVVYKSRHDKVIITCGTHGDFEQRPDAHLSGSGCPRCAIERRIECTSSNTNKFIKESTEKHNSNYSYKKTNYINARTKVIITCATHGDFEQDPTKHLSGSGCPRCAYDNNTGGYSYIFFKKQPEMKDVPATIYLFKLDSLSESYYKIGISTKLQERSKRITRESKTHITPIILHETTLFKAFMLEQEILQLYPSHKPSIKFGGSTECLTLTESDIKEIQCNIINT